MYQIQSYFDAGFIAVQRSCFFLNKILDFSHSKIVYFPKDLKQHAVVFCFVFHALSPLPCQNFQNAHHVKQNLKTPRLLLTLHWHLLPPPSRPLASGHRWLVVGNRASPVPPLLLLKSGITAIRPSEERGWNLSLKFYWADNSRLLQIHWAVSKGARATTGTYNTDIVQELLKTA